MQSIGTALFAAALLLLGRWPVLVPDLLVWGAGLAVLGAFSLLLLYRSLALGPIAVVSPVVAAYTAVTVILVVTFLGERLSLAQSVAIATVFGGVVLSSTDLRVVVATLGRPVPGVRIAFVAMLGFGLWGALMAAATREHDGLALILVGRVAGLAVMTAAALALRSAIPTDRRPMTLALVVIVGIFDTIANVLFVVGVQGGDAAIVATGSGLYPVLPALLAIAFLHERLAPNQYLGVGVLVAGLVGLGLVS
jgi:drug/metabolite transporter (DMT)-like permease